MDHATQVELVRRILRAHEQGGRSPAGERPYANPVADYTSAEQLALERERLFRATPVFAGLSDDAREPGAYFALDVAGTPVLVVRGRDLLSSTGRQLLLARCLGVEHPAVFAHHPLIGDAEGRKLSKSDGAAGLAVLRESGLGPGEVLGRAAFLGGLLPAERPLEPSGLGALLASPES